MSRTHDDKFWDLLHQISSEHERIVTHLQNENEDLRIRLRSHMPLESLGDASESATRSVEPGRQGSVSENAPNISAAVGESPRPSEQQPEKQYRIEPRSKRMSKRPSTLALVEAMAHVEETIERADVQGNNQESQDGDHRSLRQKVHWLVNLEVFELMVGGLILLNTLAMAMEMQYKGMQVGYQLGYRDMTMTANEVWPHVEDAFPVLERVFTLIFVVELALRIYGNGWRYLTSLLNWVDIFVVVVGVLDWSFQAAFPDQDVNHPLIRLLRLLRLLKGLRILAKFIRVLDLLISSIVASFSTLGYSLGLLAVVQIVASMAMVQMLSDYMNDDTKPEHERKEIYKYWGTFTLASLTMFEITFANWSPPCRALVTFVHESYAIFFYAYRCVVGFAILMVVSAVFIQKTLKQAQSKDEQLIAEQQGQAQRQRQKLLALFKHLDTSGDGTLAWDEFQCLLGQPKALSWLKAIDVEVSDLETLFKVLDGGNGDIDINEFVTTMERIKGGARSLDMLQVLRLSNETRKRLDEFTSRLMDQGQLLQSPSMKAPVYPNDTQDRDFGEGHADADVRETEHRVGPAATSTPHRLGDRDGAFCLKFSV